MTRILFVTNALNAAGAEQFMVSHLGKLDRQRYRPVVCVLHAPRGPSLEARVRELGVEIHDLRERWRPDPGVVVRLARFIRAQGIEIVQSHVVAANLAARAAGRLARVPVVTTDQTVVANVSRGYAGLARWTLPLSACAVFISDGVRDSFLRGGPPMPADRVRVIPNGVDFGAIATGAIERSAARRELAGEHADDVLVGAVGRLEPVKGQRHLVAAFPEVKRKHPRARLVLVGAGSQESALRAQVAALGLDDAVTFVGHRADVARLLCGLDLFVMPSLQEGLGVAAIEAMAAELPIVASRTGGLPEVVVDGVCGLLVPPTDEPALAQAIDRMLAQPELARTLARAGRDRARMKFSLEGVVEAYDAVYDECLARQSHSSRSRAA